MATFVRPNSVIIDIFIIVNLSFLALDIFFAHSTNEFSKSAEWIPFYFSLIAPIFLGIESWKNWINKQGKTQCCSSFLCAWPPSAETWKSTFWMWDKVMPSCSRHPVTRRFSSTRAPPAAK